MTLQLDRPRTAIAPAPGRRAVSGRKVLLRRIVGVIAVVGLLAWAFHRAVPAGGELINLGGLALLDDLAATALQPSLDADFLRVVLEATATTLALALLGTVGALVLGLIGGLILSDVAWGDRRLPWPARVARLVLRGALVAVRSVHELVWALLFVSVLGLDPLVAVLALALPFGAQTAQVFAETFDSAPDAPLRALRTAGAKRWPALAYALLPGTASLLLSYSFYRFECALRSAVVLGVAGVGGIGFELTVSLQSRNWGEVWTLVAALLVLAGLVELWSNRVRANLAVVTCADWSVGQERPDPGDRARGLSRWTRWSLLLTVPAIAVAWWWVGLSPAGLASARTRDLTGRLLGDLWPVELPEGGLPELTGAALDTVAMAVLAMALAVVITLLVGPWASRPRADRRGRTPWGRWALWSVSRPLLLVLRSVPPTVWAVVALLALFPGVLPGALALGLYTGGILGRLVAEAWETMDLRPRDSLRNAGVPGSISSMFAIAPPAANHLTGYTLYRFEICVRDTAIVGVVGAAGLGRLLGERLAAFDFGVVTSVLLASLLISVAVELLGRRLRRALQAR